jgi:hypothetical protein
MLASCMVLGVPLGLKLLLFTWIAFFFSGRALRWLAMTMGVSPSDPESLLKILMEMAFAGHGFVIMVLGTVIYYFRLSAHLETVGSGVLPSGRI